MFAPQNKIVTLKLIRYTLMMVLFPLSTFYLFQSVIFHNDKSKLAYSGLAAVIAVNIVIYAYVTMAWAENKNELIEGKQGERGQLAAVNPYKDDQVSGRNSKKTS